MDAIALRVREGNRMQTQALARIERAAQAAFRVALASALRIDSGSMPRRALPKNLKRDRKIEVVLSDDEFALLLAAGAASEGRSVSGWARPILIEAARKMGLTVVPPAPARVPRKKSRRAASR